MAVKCGSCKDKHDTVAQVRLCYERKARQQRDEMNVRPIAAGEGREYAAAVQAQERADDERAYASKPDAVRSYSGEDTDLTDALRDSIREVNYLKEQEAEHAARVLDGMTGSPGRDMASEAQVKYVMDLLAQHEWPDTLTREDVENMERRQVSKLIDALKAAPRVNMPNVQDWAKFKTIPAGRYALYIVEHHPEMDGNGRPVNADISTGATYGTWKFYQVDKPDHGKYRGRMFVKQLIGAPGDYRKNLLRGDAAIRVYERIFKDVKKAQLDYGKQSGVCGVCHSPLTNEDSLAKGIGPVCARKRGW